MYDELYEELERTYIVPIGETETPSGKVLQLVRMMTDKDEKAMTDEERY